MRIFFLFLPLTELELELDQRYFWWNGSTIGSKGKNGTGTGSDRFRKADRFMPCSVRQRSKGQGVRLYGDVLYSSARSSIYFIFHQLPH